MAVSLQELEKSAYAADPANFKLLEDIVGILENLESTGYTDPAGQPDQRLYTRLAAALSFWLLTRRERLPVDAYGTLLDKFEALSAVFSLSGFGHADHLLEILANRPDENIDIAAILLSCMPDSAATIGYEQFHALAPSEAWAWCLRVLGSRQFLTANADALRSALLDSIERVEPPEFSPQAIDLMIHAWMHCSYADHPRKHGLKAVINRQLRSWLLKSGARDSELSARHPNGRPRLLVVAEHFNSSHAMYRTYADWVAQLERDFDVYLLMNPDLIDNGVRKRFPRVVGLTRSDNFKDVATQVQDLRPDVIFYPSLGMQAWSVLLANLRLARVQCVGLGHPATSRCDTIDYMLTVDGTAPDPGCFSEKLILLDRMYLTYPPAVPKNTIAVSHGQPVLRVAIASSVMKLNWKFIGTLANIARQAERRLEFHFLAGERGIHHQALAARLGDALGSVSKVVVHPYLNYADYMRALFRCEVHLETWPFGGTNSNVDSLLLGIPVVCMDGPEPHSSIDGLMLRKLGLPGWLVCKDVAEYERAALRLIRDDEERARVSELVKNAPLTDYLVEPDDSQNDYEFCDTLSWLHRNHEHLLAAEQRVWRPGERPEYGDRNNR